MNSQYQQQYQQQQMQQPMQQQIQQPSLPPPMPQKPIYIMDESQYSDDQDHSQNHKPRQFALTLKYAILGLALFFVLSHPEAYRLVNWAVSIGTRGARQTALDSGQPLPLGLAAHTLLFFVLFMIIAYVF